MIRLAGAPWCERATLTKMCMWLLSAMILEQNHWLKPCGSRFLFQPGLPLIKSSESIAPMSTPESCRCHIFFSITLIYISQSPFIKKTRFKRASRSHSSARSARRSIVISAGARARCFRARGVRFRSHFGIVLMGWSPLCALVDSQWEISAPGGAAVTWSPPFIKYLPAHSQHCMPFRIAPTITQWARSPCNAQHCEPFLKKKMKRKMAHTCLGLTDVSSLSPNIVSEKWLCHRGSRMAPFLFTALFIVPRFSVGNTPMYFPHSISLSVA